jgi:hypothetical protein
MSIVSEQYARASQAERIQRAVAERQAWAARHSRREERRSARAQRRADYSAGRVAVARA